MPAKSKAQQRFFGLVRGIQEGKVAKSVSSMAAKAARTMKVKSVRHFAKTKLSGLPERKTNNPGTKIASNSTKKYPGILDTIKKIRERKNKQSKVLEEMES